jgi:predicted Ser/Thr protein kinase
VARTDLRSGDPSRIGRYRLVARLGAGGMGVVYLGEARDGARVAVKVMRAELADDDAFRARFRREVASLSRVQGVCTVRVVEADTEAPQPFLVTEYADGPSLAEHVAATGPMPPGMLYGLATGLAEALAAIHAAGVIHRDLKPSNVLLSASGPKVIDFGIAQALDATAVTRTGMAVGSAGFMAPEQIAGNAGQPADVFAWGLVVGYAASGLQPFGTGPTDAILYRIMHHSPEITAVPEELRPLVEAALDKDPERRPSARDLTATLTSPARRAGEGDDAATQVVLARTWLLPAGQPRAAGARPCRGRLLALLGAAAAVAAVAGAGAAFLAHGSPAGTAAAGTLAPTPRVAATPGTRGTTTAPRPAKGTAADVSGPGAAAASYVYRDSYTPERGFNPPWEPDARLNVILASYTGGASGPVKAFFFGDGKYLGTDTPDGSAGLTARRDSGSEFTFGYPIYAAGDPQCCPTGGTQAVRFSWTAGQLNVLDPIPPTGERF